MWSNCKRTQSNESRFIYQSLRSNRVGFCRWSSAFVTSKPVPTFTGIGVGHCSKLGPSLFRSLRYLKSLDWFSCELAGLGSPLSLLRSPPAPQAWYDSVTWLELPVAFDQGVIWCRPSPLGHMSRLHPGNLPHGRLILVQRHLVQRLPLWSGRRKTCQSTITCHVTKPVTIGNPFAGLSVSPMSIRLGEPADFRKCSTVDPARCESFWNSYNHNPRILRHLWCNVGEILV